MDAKAALSALERLLPALREADTPFEWTPENRSALADILAHLREQIEADMELINDAS